MAQAHFADRLAALVEERRSRVVLGLDPDPAALWPAALEGVGGEPQVATAEAVVRHCAAAIEAAGPACVAVKLQLACFERLGAPGWDALARVRDAAREHGLLVVADGKRGDVPVTAAAYGQALVGSTPGPFGEVAGLGADAFTANPLLGRDSIEPLLSAAAAAGAGCFLLVNTSNPGASDLQDLDAGGAPLYERMAALVDAAGADRLGECGLSLAGAVVGATRPERVGRLRELMPRAIFLLPGRRRPGRKRGGARARVRAAPGRRTGHRVAFDRERARGARGRAGRRGGGGGAGAARRVLGLVT